MRRALLVLSVVVLVATPVIGTPPGPVQSSQDTPEADNTITRIELEPNGSAVWSIQFRTRLTNESEVDEYRAFQAEFRNDTASFLDPFRERITSVVANAANETGREMTATQFSASTSIQQVPRRFGVVTFRFRWVSFADDQLTTGDVFADGFFVGSNDTLVITAPDGYRLESVEPTPDERTDQQARWFGQVSFGEDRPRVVAVPQPTPTATATQPSPTPQPTTATTVLTTATGDSGGFPVVPVVAAGLIAIILGALGYRAGVFDRDGSTGGGGVTDSGGPTDSGGATGRSGSSDSGPTDSADSTDSAGPTDGADPTDSGGASPQDRPSDDTGTANDAPTNGETTDDTSDPYEAVLADIRPPLTDEDRVRKALAENGGRMRQSDIAETLEWSASKTSRVLSAMTDDGTVEKLRVGRQNVIDLVIDEE